MRTHVPLHGPHRGERSKRVRLGAFSGAVPNPPFCYQQQYQYYDQQQQQQQYYYYYYYQKVTVKFLKKGCKTIECKCECEVAPAETTQDTPTPAFRNLLHQTCLLMQQPSQISIQHLDVCCCCGFPALFVYLLVYMCIHIYIYIYIYIHTYVYVLLNTTQQNRKDIKTQHDKTHNDPSSPLRGGLPGRLPRRGHVPLAGHRLIMMIFDITLCIDNDYNMIVYTYSQLNMSNGQYITSTTSYNRICTTSLYIYIYIYICI